MPSSPQDPELERSTSGWIELTVGVVTSAIGVAVMGMAWPEAIAWLWLFPAMGVPWIAFGVRNVRRGRQRARRVAAVRAGGVHTSATVVALDQMSPGGDGSDPVVMISLQVAMPGGGSRRASVRCTMPVTLIPRVQPGAELPVAVDRTDRSLVVVDWRLFQYGPAAEPDGGEAVDLSEVDALLAAGRFGKASGLYLQLTGAEYAEAKVALTARLAAIKRRTGR